MGGDSGKDLDTNDGPLGSNGYSSPPCMLYELDPAFPESVGRKEELPVNDAQEQAEVRLWRRAKRAVLIERRLAIPVAERAAISEAITAVLTQILSSFQDPWISFYGPFKGEYNQRSLIRSLQANGVRLALPVVIEKRRPMIFRPWRPGAPMTPGIQSIPVPAVGAPIDPDILLVPLVGFDRQRYRLGCCGGYYNRTLAAMSRQPYAIGTGFGLAQVSTIDPQPHDLPMDLVVTKTSL